MKKHLLAATLTLLALPVSAATVGETTGVNSMLGIAPATKDFVTEAAISDMFEIQSSKLAATKLQGSEKDFADHMVMDHTKTSAELTSLAGGANVAIPTAMDNSHQKMLDTLNSLNGDDFRKQYLSDQTTAHKDAVSLFHRYGDGGENPKLKSWASATLPILQHHLDMAQDLYKKS